MYILSMERELGLGATAIGFVFAAGGAGALIGALFAGRVATRFGFRPAMILGQLGFGVTGLLVPIAVLVLLTSPLRSTRVAPLTAPAPAAAAA